MVKANKRKKTIPAKEFEQRFDAGQEVLSEFDLNTAIKKVNVDFPVWMIKVLDEEAQKLGIPRQALIKTWLNDRIELNKRRERRSVG